MMLVSVIMPAYNAEKYIGQAIESVQKQTYENWELLIIDDGSTDKTCELVNQKALEDSRICLHKNPENKGVSYTRNRGVQLAKGEWIAFLDSDDMWQPEKLQKQIDLAANKKDSALIFTATAFMNEQGEPAKYILHVPYKITYWQLLKQNIISCSSVFVKKECMRDVKMPGDQMHEDFAAWLQILKKIPCAYGIDEPLLNYRISSGTKSSNKIKAFKMTMRVYKYIGLNIFERMYYMCWYVFKNLLKYAQIKIG